MCCFSRLRNLTAQSSSHLCPLSGATRVITLTLLEQEVGTVSPPSAVTDRGANARAPAGLLLRPGQLAVTRSDLAGLSSVLELAERFPAAASRAHAVTATAELRAPQELMRGVYALALVAIITVA